MGPQTARTPSGSKLVGRQPRGEACPGPTASHAPRAEGALLRPTIRAKGPLRLVVRLDSVTLPKRADPCVLG